MRLPFTADAFLQVFARYNDATWPAVVVLWIAAAGALVSVVRAPGEWSSPYTSAVLAVLRLWGGLVYHAKYFTSINPRRGALPRSSWERPACSSSPNPTLSAK